MNRRRFLAGSGAAVLGGGLLMALQPSLLTASPRFDDAPIVLISNGSRPSRIFADAFASQSGRSSDVSTVDWSDGLSPAALAAYEREVAKRRTLVAGLLSWSEWEVLSMLTPRFASLHEMSHLRQMASAGSFRLHRAPTSADSASPLISSRQTWAATAGLLAAGSLRTATLRHAEAIQAWKSDGSTSSTPFVSFAYLTV